jgi:hypothetical protein
MLEDAVARNVKSEKAKVLVVTQQLRRLRRKELISAETE